MARTPTALRALAASVVMVVAAGTLAAAATLHLPILGMDASNAGARTATTVAVRRPHAPVRIVRTRVVVDVVHRAAPVAVGRASVSYSRPRRYTRVAPSTVPTSVAAPPVVTTSTTTLVPPPPTPASHDHEQDGQQPPEHQHDGSTGNGGSDR